MILSRPNQAESIYVTTVLKESYPYYLANQAHQPNTDLVVTDKFSGAAATTVALADSAALGTAIATAADARDAMRALRSHQRRDVLLHCVGRFNERRDELAESLCVEAGKPIRDARGEVTRLIETFRIAAEESTRIYGEVVPLDISERSANYTGMWKRVPIGACSFITPFNFPLNLVAHKVAPALACGCPFVLKPADVTPVGALIIGEVLAETDLPAGAFSILPLRVEDADPLVTDDRLKLLSFTGSADVGFALKARAGKKRVALELGGNAACIIDADTDIDDAVDRCIFGGFYQSGQSCVSVQRILIHASIYQHFRDRLVSAASALVVGDPRDANTVIGPLISEQAAIRVEQAINEAREAGAQVLCGGRRRGCTLDATVLENASYTASVSCREVFGPVVTIEKFRDFEDALRIVNDSTFGLQAGVFTRDIHKAHRAWEVLEVGGVIINDVPSWRVDHMPYGGVKDSGLGREGVRFSIQEMTEIRFMAIRSAPLA